MALFLQMFMWLSVCASLSCLFCSWCPCSMTSLSSIGVPRSKSSMPFKRDLALQIYTSLTTTLRNAIPT